MAITDAASRAERQTPEESGSDFPVFVVGAGRSGTTLLYSLLMASGAFPIYEAESMIMECAPKYGDLKNRRNLERLLDDYLSSRQFHRSGLDAEAFRREAVSHCSTYPALLRFFMEKMAASQGKTRWVEKTPNHVFHMQTLAREFPAARFVHVIRDGRSVAVSDRSAGRRSPIGDSAILRLIWAGQIWEMAVRHGRRMGEHIPNRYIEVRYEEMIQDLESVLSRLRDFLRLPLTRADVESSQVGTLASANSCFGEKMEGISNKGLNRWEKTLNREEIDTLNRLFGETLRDLGYEISAAGASRRLSVWEALFSPFFYWTLRINRVVKQRTPVGRMTEKPLEIGLR